MPKGSKFVGSADSFFAAGAPPPPPLPNRSKSPLLEPPKGLPGLEGGAEGCAAGGADAPPKGFPPPPGAGKGLPAVFWGASEGCARKEDMDMGGGPVSTLTLPPPPPPPPPPAPPLLPPKVTLAAVPGMGRSTGRRLLLSLNSLTMERSGARRSRPRLAAWRSFPCCCRAGVTDSQGFIVLTASS